jgi:hypothetical protein
MTSWPKAVAEGFLIEYISNVCPSQIGFKTFFVDCLMMPSVRGRQIQGARSPWCLNIFTWPLNFHGFLSLYLQKKSMLAPELFLVLSTPAISI